MKEEGRKEKATERARYCHRIGEPEGFRDQRQGSLSISPQQSCDHPEGHSDASVSQKHVWGSATEATYIVVH